MRHVENLLIKSVFITALIWLIGIPLGRSTSAAVLAAGILVALVLYFLGDLFLLPAVGNLASSLVNGLLAVIMLASLRRILPGFHLSIPAVALLGPALVIGEYYLHRWFILREQRRVRG